MRTNIKARLCMFTRKHAYVHVTSGFDETTKLSNRNNVVHVSHSHESEAVRCTTLRKVCSSIVILQVFGDFMLLLSVSTWHSHAFAFENILRESNVRGKGREKLL